MSCGMGQMGERAVQILHGKSGHTDNIAEMTLSQEEDIAE